MENDISDIFNYEICMLLAFQSFERDNDVVFTTNKHIIVDWWYSLLARCLPRISPGFARETILV